MELTVALTVAGTDSAGGAGIVADAKTFTAHGVWAAVAVTAVTAQDTTGVHAVHVLPPALVVAQIECVRADLNVKAAKTGMLAAAATVVAVAEALQGLPLVVDPVLEATHGQPLLAGANAAELVVELLVPMATVVTPNLAEAAALVSGEVRDRPAMEEAARQLVARGARAALVTGGHLDDGAAADCLVLGGIKEARWLEGPRVDQPHTHGSGCVLSAAITANLARGDDIESACRKAKVWTAGAIAAGRAMGRGTGPVDPAWS